MKILYEPVAVRCYIKKSCLMPQHQGRAIEDLFFEKAAFCIESKYPTLTVYICCECHVDIYTKKIKKNRRKKDETN